MDPMWGKHMNRHQGLRIWQMALLCFWMVWPAWAEEGGSRLSGVWFDVGVDQPFAPSFLEQDLSIAKDATLIQFSDFIEIGEDLQQVRFIGRSSKGSHIKATGLVQVNPTKDRILFFEYATGEGARTSDTYARVWVLSPEGNDKLLYGRLYVISAFAEEAFQTMDDRYSARQDFLPLKRILAILDDVRVSTLDESRKIYQPSAQVRFTLEGADAFVREGVAETDLEMARAKARKTAEEQKSREALFKTLIRQGDTAYNSGEWAQALDQYKAASTIRPDKPLVYADLGAVYQVQKKLPEAEASYRLALELDPSDVDVLYNLGMVREQRGELQEAIEIYRKVLQKRPGDREAKDRLTKLTLRLGH